ncbi:DNA-protecting protein DprA [Ferruginibacter lapsinanis]|uniref:DNA-processing protein DprA n=1 Tax=Ferruginibacter lapsinanis TaxID=563172 RepID=UPI001E2A2957|nr:DNA-processing protein DprA [Ferruginibacter lapsinanis]UEG50316.1 DNA-protecting protein DprA [Ferruginibacter lapsinanis]
MISIVELLAISSIAGIGDQTLRRIIKSNLSIRELKNIDNTSLSQIFNNQKSLEGFLEQYENARESAEDNLMSFETQGIQVLHYYSEDYPPLLRLIDDFPIFLFCKGNTKLLKNTKNVAVIGTRECSEVGSRIARNTASYFAEHKYTIVSGLAKGIDAIGHKAALDANGKTIAVLIDVAKIYPKENTELANRILSNDGLLISENRPGSFQGKNAFVLRDRIQSGLSLAIFPIETDIVGGTMHTVKYATKQQRYIFVPNVYNDLIRNQYEISVGFSFGKIQGIRHLIDTKQAIPYIKDDYKLMEDRLMNLETTLLNDHIFKNPTLVKANESIVEKNEVTVNNQQPDLIISEPTEIEVNLGHEEKELIKTDKKQELKVAIFEIKNRESQLSGILDTISKQLSDCKQEYKDLTKLLKSFEKEYKELLEDTKTKSTKKKKPSSSSTNNPKLFTNESL